MISIFITFTHYIVYKSDSIKVFDYRLYDVTNNLFKKHETHKDESHVIVVDIDEKSLSEIGQWPWPRVMLAQLLDKINGFNPSSIGFDIIFPEKDRTSPKEIASFYKNFFNIESNISGLPATLLDNDILFSRSIEDSKSVLSVYLSKDNILNNNCKFINSINIPTAEYKLLNSEYILCNTPELSKSVKNFGFVNTNVDEDGILRRMPLIRQYNNTIDIPSFALATLLNIDSDFKVSKDGDFEYLDHTIVTDKSSNVMLSYYDESWYKKVSAIDILRGDVSADRLTGKIVLIGSSAAALHDRVVIPGGKSIIGLKVHVTFIDNLLNDEFLVQPEEYKYINIWISLLMSFLLVILLVSKLNNWILALFFVVVVSTAIVDYYAINSGVYLSLGYLIAPFLIHFFIISVLYIIIDTYERKIFSEELNRSHVALLDSMVHVAEVHDIETGAHIVRTKKYIKVLAEHIYAKGIYRKELSPKIIEMMYRTAPLHDLGKVGIPDAILKKNGKLTFEEFEVMKTHSEIGKHIINNAISSYHPNDFFIMARNIANYHHEKWDGSGYPEGLSGDNIPIESRMMAIADVYDALVSKRVYKKAFTYEETIKIIVDGSGKHFDPVLVEAFLEIQDQFRDIADNNADHVCILRY